MSDDYVNSLRREQYERGYEGVQMLAKFLESQTGILTVSVNEATYSQGNNYFPDLVFLNYGAEVKRAEFLTKSRFNKGQNFRPALGAIHINNAGWHYLKEHCAKTSKHLVLIAVVTFGKQAPIFVGMEQSQIDSFIAEFEQRNPQARPTEYEGQLVYKQYRRASGVFAGHHHQGNFCSMNVFRLLREGRILNNPENFKRFFKDLPPEYLHGRPDAVSELSDALKDNLLQK